MGLAWGGVEVVQQPLYVCDEWRQFIVYCAPYQSIVDSVILVDEYVSHSYDFPPVYFRGLPLDAFVNPVGGFADNA